MDRVAFHNRDAADAELSGRYDWSRCSRRGTACRIPSKSFGQCARCSPRAAACSWPTNGAADRFSPDAADVERLHDGFSVLHCLPVGMVRENTAGTRTVMRPDTVRRYADQAGFTHFEMVPIEQGRGAPAPEPRFHARRELLRRATRSRRCASVLTRKVTSYYGPWATVAEQLCYPTPWPEGAALPPTAVQWRMTR